MLATPVSAGVVVVGAFVLGQAILRLCGTRTRSWLAGPVGLAALLLLAVPALHVPGRCATLAVAFGLLLLACLALVVRDPALRPRGRDLVAAIPLVALVGVPFLAAGHVGTLGVGLNNDMGAHLLLADGYRYPAVEAVNGIVDSYPLGAHALVAVIGTGTGFDTDLVFAGVTAAVPVLLGLTALAALSERAGVVARLVVATVAGLPFLVAGYYGQGSFKELMQLLFVLGFTLELRRAGEVTSRLRWIPAGLLAGGMLSVYSVQGLAWPAAVAGVWLAGLVAIALARRGPGVRRAVAVVGRELVPIVLAVGVLLVVLVPQLPRLARFARATTVNGTGIPADSLGNLAGPLPLSEAFGIWNSGGDYRLPTAHGLLTILGIGLVVALVIVGAAWWVRRGDWVLPGAALACFAIWVFSERTQSPYVTAKALVLLSPLLLLIAVRPLVERDRGARTPRWLARVVAPALAAVVVVGVVASSWDALRVSPVGGRAHLTELRQLRPLVGRDQTLFLGNDDFVRWELGGVPATAVIFGGLVQPTRPQKPWAYARPLDLDSMDSAFLNRFRWVITTRDAAGSAPPAQLRLVRETRDFSLYERTGTLPRRDVLAEGEGPAARLDCRSPDGYAISRAPGVAGVRLGPVGVLAAPLLPGARGVVRLDLTPGAWDLVTPYTSTVPLDVEGPGLDATLPPNYDRPGPRWPIGRITVARAGTVTLRLRAHDPWLAPDRPAAFPAAIIAVPAFGERVVPLRRACGRLVDWYRITPR